MGVEPDIGERRTSGRICFYIWNDGNDDMRRSLGYPTLVSEKQIEVRAGEYQE